MQWLGNGNLPGCSATADNITLAFRCASIGMGLFDWELQMAGNCGGGTVFPTSTTCSPLSVTFGIEFTNCCDGKGGVVLVTITITEAP